MFVDAPGARLAVYLAGGPGDAVMLLHGGPGVPDYLEDVAWLLAPRHRVIRFDQRGTGRSECLSGRYGLEDYVADVEAVRASFQLERFHAFGHSWGGTVAQLYASRYPGRIGNLCLCNSGIGLGEDWRAMERAVMQYNRSQSGLAGFARLGLDQLCAMLPGAWGDAGAGRMMARVWSNYFRPPESAPPASAAWLSGVRARAIFATRKAAVAAEASALQGVRPSGEVIIAFGEYDIYGDTASRLIARYPQARVITLRNAGHVPWIQNPVAFQELLALL